MPGGNSTGSAKCSLSRLPSRTGDRTVAEKRAACRGDPRFAARRRQDRPCHAARRGYRHSATQRTANARPSLASIPRSSTASRQPCNLGALGIFIGNGRGGRISQCWRSPHSRPRKARMSCWVSSRSVLARRCSRDTRRSRHVSEIILNCRGNCVAGGFGSGASACV
jgi:hypothetical protein